jgi:hypothetical protein
MPSPADVAAVLARPVPQRPAYTSRTPQPFRVTRLGDRIVIVRDGARGGLVADLDPASARLLARQLDRAAGRP